MNPSEVEISTIRKYILFNILKHEYATTRRKATGDYNPSNIEQS